MISEKATELKIKALEDFISVQGKTIKQLDNENESGIPGTDYGRLNTDYNKLRQDFKYTVEKNQRLSVELSISNEKICELCAKIEVLETKKSLNALATSFIPKTVVRT